MTPALRACAGVIVPWRSHVRQSPKYLPPRPVVSKPVAILTDDLLTAQCPEQVLFWSNVVYDLLTHHSSTTIQPRLTASCRLTVRWPLHVAQGAVHHGGIQPFFGI